MVFGDFDADGLTGLAQLVLALRRLGLDDVPVRAVPRSRRATASRSRPWTAAAAAGRHADRDGGHGLHERRRGRRGRRARDRRPRSRTTTTCPTVLPAAVAHRQPAPARTPSTRTPSCRAAGVAFTVARLLLGRARRRRGGRPRPRRPRHDRDGLGRGADPRREPGDRPPRPRADAHRAAARDRRAARSARASRPATVDLETVGFVLAPRLNAAGRVGEALDAARLLLAETPEEAAALAATLEAANIDPPGPDAHRDRRGPAAFGLPDPAPGARPGRRCLDAPATADADRRSAAARTPRRCSSAGRGRSGSSAWSPVASPTRRAGPRSSGRRSATWSGPRAGATGGSTWPTTLDACGDLLVRHGGHAAAAGFELPADRWDAFAERFLAAGRGRPRPRTRAAARRGPRAAGRLRGLRACTGTSPASRPCGTGNPEPLVAVLGLTVQRVRAANGGHTQLVLRRERDVLDGIAFGRAGPRARRSPRATAWTSSPASRAGRSAASRRSSSRSGTSPPSGVHPRAAEVLGARRAASAGVPVGPGMRRPVAGGIA